jgi:hypothetical protein
MAIIELRRAGIYFAIKLLDLYGLTVHTGIVKG